MSARDSMPPELLELATLCRNQFGSKLISLQVPGATFGQLPAWLDWPTVKLSEMGPPVRTVAERVRSTRTGRAA